MRVIIKNWAPFTGCISEISNTQWNHTKGIDLVMPIYNLIEYSDKYSKTWGHLWLCERDESALNAAGAIIDFLGANNNSTLFKFKQKITGQTENDGTKMLK